MISHILTTKIKEASSLSKKWQSKNTEFEKLSFPLRYSTDGLDINILSAKETPNNLLKVQLTVRKNKKTLNVNAPFYFQNPPVKVPNGTFKKKEINGEIRDIELYEINILEAMKAFVLDAIKTQLK